MKQEFYTVWREGSEWFDFPTSNEQAVMDMLVKKNIMQHCIILPMGETPHSIKKVVITQIAEEKTIPTKTTQTKKK